jgi:hypothetical protein
MLFQGRSCAVSLTAHGPTRPKSQGDLVALLGESELMRPSWPPVRASKAKTLSSAASYGSRESTNHALIMARCGVVMGESSAPRTSLASVCNFSAAAPTHRVTCRFSSLPPPQREWTTDMRSLKAILVVASLTIGVRMRARYSSRRGGGSSMAASDDSLFTRRGPTCKCCYRVP